MNVNVIKQFSVYLKLQTFTLCTPSRVGSQKITFFASETKHEDNAKNIVFFFFLRDPVASETKKKLLFLCYEIFVLNLYIFGCWLSLTVNEGKKSSPKKSNRKMKMRRSRRKK